MIAPRFLGPPNTPPDRTPNSLGELLDMAVRRVAQVFPHIRSPYTMATVVSYDSATKTSLIKKAGDANANGYHYPHLLMFSDTNPPVGGQSVVVRNGPEGPFIEGYLSH